MLNKHTNSFSVWRDYQIQLLSVCSNIHILYIPNFRPMRGILPMISKLFLGVPSKYSQIGSWQSIQGSELAETGHRQRHTQTDN